MNKFLGLLIYFSFGIVFAQNPHRIFESVEIIENQSLEIKVNDGLYKIVPYTKNIVQTRKASKIKNTTHSSIFLNIFLINLI